MLKLSNRAPWGITPWELEEAVKGKRVLVTGAGGSIGSELSKLVAKGSPEHLSLLSHSEYPIYSIHSALTGLYPDLSCHRVLADIRSLPRMEQVMREERPQIVFHCAAIKHLPMAEDAPCEAVLTNVIGTFNILESLPENSKVVLVSTDKAVYPSSVMGGTKRVAELLCASSGTCYRIVRLGNVIGSSGSVVPLFQKRIAAGETIHVTHKDVSRYFMEIPEAAALIIQSLTVDKGGMLFILDMGKPVKIYDLAAKMIQDSGKQIPIEFTGLRPGEKIEEELFYPEEKPIRSRCDGLFQGNPRISGYAFLTLAVEKLAKLANEGDSEGVKTVLNTLLTMHEDAA